MTWTASADPDTFDEAVLWFLLRTPMTREQWDALTAAERRRAFTVSSVARADVLQDVFRALDQALANGKSLTDFKRDVGQKLREAWQGSVANPPWRLETIYRTNLQGAYGAGRWQQMTQPSLSALRPFGKYDAVMDNRVTERCESLDGTVLPWGEWESAGLVPPIHFNCRSSLRSLRKSQADKEPKRTAPPGIAAQDGFGGAPAAEEWQPDLEKYPPELRAEVEARLQEAPVEPMDPPTGVEFVKGTSRTGTTPTDAKDVRKQLRQLAPTIGWDGSLDALDARALDEFGRELADLAIAVPDVGITLKMIKAGELIEGVVAQIDGAADGFEITLSITHFSNYRWLRRRLRRDEAEWHLPGTGTIAGSAAHEFGHAILRMFEKLGVSSEDLRRLQSADFSGYPRGIVEAPTPWREAFADGFAALWLAQGLTTADLKLIIAAVVVRILGS